MQFLSKFLILLCLFVLTSCLELFDNSQDPKQVFTPPPVKIQKRSKNGMRSTEDIPIGNFTTQFRVDFPAEKPKPKPKAKIVKPKPVVKKEEPKPAPVRKIAEAPKVEPEVENIIEDKIIEEPKPVPAAKPEVELTDEELKALEAKPEIKKIEEPRVEEPKTVQDKEVEGFKYVEMKREVSSVKAEEAKKEEEKPKEEPKPEPKQVEEPKPEPKEEPKKIEEPKPDEPFGCTLTAIQPDIEFGEEADLRLELFGHPESYQVINPAEEGGPKEFRDTDKQRFYYVGMVTKNGKTEWCSTKIYVHFKKEPETEWFDVKEDALIINGKNQDVAVQIDETKDKVTVTLLELKKQDNFEIGGVVSKKSFSKKKVSKIKIHKRKNFSRAIISDEGDPADHIPVEFY